MGEFSWDTASDDLSDDDSPAGDDRVSAAAAAAARNDNNTIHTRSTSRHRGIMAAFGRGPVDNSVSDQAVSIARIASSGSIFIP